MKRQETDSTRTKTFCFFNDTATTEIYTLSLHDALPISTRKGGAAAGGSGTPRHPLGSLEKAFSPRACRPRPSSAIGPTKALRSEEHTSELQSRQYLVCGLLFEKKKQTCYSSAYRSPPYT